MKHVIPSACAAATLVLVSLATPLRGQGFPVISSRIFTGGSAKVIVTGSFTINEDVPMNPGSMGDPEMTWLDFNSREPGKPTATITYNGESKEIGINVARGKLVATGGIVPGESSPCSGKVEVTARLISGKYTCRGVSSYDPATGKMGKVDIEITFTAKS